MSRPDLTVTESILIRPILDCVGLHLLQKKMVRDCLSQPRTTNVMATMVVYISLSGRCECE